MAAHKRQIKTVEISILQYIADELQIACHWPFHLDNAQAKSYIYPAFNVL